MTETTILTLCFLTLGIFLIIRGGDAFVDAAGWIAEISGIPQFIIGATVVSIATTLPELFVSALAALAGKADMAVGNAVGSVTANLGFIMALSLICLPCVMRRRQFVTKGALMAMAATLLIIGSAGGYLTLADSILLLIIFLIFILENIRSARKGTLSPPAGPVRNIVAPGEWRQNITKFIFGAAAILIGAKLMVQNGSQLAMILGVPERIIAVTVIAIGTSLPELVTTLTAIAKHQSALSIGNIIGANILDLTLILPLCALLSGGEIMISHHMGLLDMPACLGVILLAMIPPLFHGRFSRRQGIVMLIYYLVYLVVLCLS